MRAVLIAAALVVSGTGDWPAAGPLSAAAGCLDAALAKARFTCPLTGAADVTATLEISVGRF